MAAKKRRKRRAKRHVSKHMDMQAQALRMIDLSKKIGNSPAGSAERARLQREMNDAFTDMKSAHALRYALSD